MSNSYKTALIEKYESLGGTGLNVGCIPSKALLETSKHYYQAIHKFKDHGIEIDRININMDQMINRKNSVIKQSSDGIRLDI